MLALTRARRYCPYLLAISLFLIPVRSCNFPRLKAAALLYGRKIKKKKKKQKGKQDGPFALGVTRGLGWWYRSVASGVASFFFSDEMPREREAFGFIGLKHKSKEKRIACARVYVSPAVCVLVCGVGWDANLVIYGDFVSSISLTTGYPLRVCRCCCFLLELLLFFIYCCFYCYITALCGWFYLIVVKQGAG
ncbi:hypothetical protein V8C35DRAFT_297244 [Trichoderma chlorosporum]